MVSAEESENDLNIVQLIYCSTYHSDKNYSSYERDINDITNQSEIRNSLHDITSGLVSDQRYFAHVIEGTPKSVRQLYSNIVFDKRHAKIVLLQYTVINIRLFYLWPLVFVEVDEILHISKLTIQSTSAELRKASVSILQSFRPFFLNEV